MRARSARTIRFSESTFSLPLLGIFCSTRSGPIPAAMGETPKAFTLSSQLTPENGKYGAKEKKKIQKIFKKCEQFGRLIRLIG
jgi:hypothetical protein